MCKVTSPSFVTRHAITIQCKDPQRTSHLFYKCINQQQRAELLGVDSNFRPPVAAAAEQTFTRPRKENKCKNKVFNDLPPSRANLALTIP